MYKEVDLSIMILRALLSANAVEVANLNRVRGGGEGRGEGWDGMSDEEKKGVLLN